MTIYKIEHVVEMVEESKGTSNPVQFVWEYTNANNNKPMFAVFTFTCYCDIYESPAVLNPVCIYENGRFAYKYAYLNEDYNE